MSRLSNWAMRHCRRKFVKVLLSNTSDLTWVKGNSVDCSQYHMKLWIKIPRRWLDSTLSSFGFIEPQFHFSQITHGFIGNRCSKIPSVCHQFPFTRGHKLDNYVFETNCMSIWRFPAPCFLPIDFKSHLTREGNCVSESWGMKGRITGPPCPVICKRCWSHFIINAWSSFNPQPCNTNHGNYTKWISFRATWAGAEERTTHLTYLPETLHVLDEEIHFVTMGAGMNIHWWIKMTKHQVPIVSKVGASLINQHSGMSSRKLSDVILLHRLFQQVLKHLFHTWAVEVLENNLHRITQQ